MSSRRPRGGSSNNEDGKPPPEQRASLSAHKPTTASLTSPGGSNNDGGWGSPSRFGHFAKYTKPKIGPTYQCAVPKYVPPGDKKDGGETSGNESTGSTSASGSGSARNSGSRGGGRGGRGGRRGGRGGRGGRGRGGRGGGRGGVAAMDQQLEQKLVSGEKSAVDMANAAAEHFQDAYGKSINNIPRGGLCVHKPLDRQSSSSMKSDNNNTTKTTTNGLQQLDGSSSSIPPSQKLSSLNKQEDYLTYTRNLYLQTPRLHNEMNIDKIWDEETAKNYKVDEVPEAKTSSSKKGGKKRKAAAVESSNSIPASSSKPADAPSSMDIDQSKNNEGEEEKELLPLCGLEDDEQALSYLQANYHGDSEKAKLSIMVNSDRGNGVQRRRQLKKKRKEADAEYPDATTFTSESWRWRVHQARPSMLGDYRSSRDPNYHYFDPSPIETDNLLDSSMPWRLRRFGDDSNDLSSSTAELHSPSRPRSYSIAWSEEEIDKAKKIWKSILAYAKHTLAKMEEDDDEEDDEVTDNNNTKPPLNDLLELVGKAHALPTPEETFGRRDLSARQMSDDMNLIIDAIDSGRDYVARLLKSLKDDGEGIELDTLKQSIDEIEHLCPVGLSELITIKRQVQEATLWEEKLESNVDHGTADSDASDGEDNDDDENNVMTEKKLTLEKVERLVSKGRNLTLRPRSLVRLQNRVEKAHILRKKISVWNEARNQENPQNMKFITSLIKEANKVDLAFPELFTLTGVHKKAEEWMDRASVAARTTITFEELESLVTKGEGLPLNVSDVLEKLQKRLTLAKEWMARIDEIVPKSDDFLVWLKRFRHALEDSNKSAHLLSLLSEGSRIPVTMQCSQLLQIEIDARHWSAKAKPWIPENLDTEGEISAPQKRGKVDDVEEYLDRAASIRERLWFDEKEKSEWILDGESELRQMLEMAEEWFDKYDDIISHDNRRKGKLCLPMSKVSTIATEVNRIPLNLGNPATKINKAFTQCDEWMAKYLPLIKRCGIECTYTPTTTGATDESSMQVDEEDDDDSTAPLKLDELSEAVGEADSDLFFDLEVVVKMRKIQETAQTWFDKVDEIAPKEAEAKKKGKHSMNELSFLINQSTTLLVDVADEVERLKLVQNTTMSWRTQAQQNLREIIAGFDNFRKERSANCGRNGAATLTNAVAVASTVPSALESSTIPNPIESVPPPAVHLAVDTIMEEAEDEKQSSDVKEKSHSPAAPPTAHEPWECSKCSTRNLSTKSRCSKCLGWRGGSRVGASKVPAGEPARLKIKARTPSAAPPSANDSVSSAGSMTTRHINSRRGAHGTTGDTATSTTLGSEFQIPVYNGNGGDHLFALVTNFVNSVKTMNILTPEGNTADELNEVVNWFTKAFKLMNNLSDIYDRKSFSKLDKLIKSGQKLVKFKKMTGVRLEDMELLDDLRQSWAAAVNDDNARLLDLQNRRDKFVEWCEKADGAISSTDKKVPIETLKELELQSASFPQSEIVLRVQKRAKDATEWIAYVADILKKGKKIPLNEAKVLADKGDKLNVSCPEYKTVRAALKATKAWLTKVKKCGAKDGQAEVATSVVNELINEHKTFLVTSEDSLSGLQQVMCGYCVCRQPYEGFMIGCDGCEEWYHGPCVGISQEQGDKLDKYVCVRCSTLRVYKDNATTVAAILRKWTSAKNLSKARAADSQRYGRKVRKAEQDIVKARTNKNSIEQELNAILQAISAEKLQANGGGAAVAAPPPTNGGLIPAGTQNPSVAVPVVSEQSAKLAKSEKALQEKIAKANTTITNCEKRMEGYKTELIERKNLEAREDVLALSIKKWCAIVKQDIFAPRTLAKAELSRPGADGSLSAPMNKAKLYAESLGIDKLPDIDVILNSFKIFAWTLHSLEVLMRKPRAEEIRLILSHIDNGSVKLGEAKCVRMIKSMSSRAQIWQAKANRALAPVSNDRTPYDLSILKELLSGAKQIPLIMPEEARLWNTIEDHGTRHCICGGPSDGSFMLGCDNCDRWFHGSCMKIDKATGDALSKWICPPCTKGIYVQDTAAANVATETKTVSDDDNKFVNPMEQKYHLDISSHAPDPSELWPPFNLRNDKEAVEVLGKAGESDNEDFTSSSGGSLKAPPQMAPQGPPQIGTDPKLASVTTSLPIARLDSQGSSSSASSYNFAQQPLMAARASASSGPRGLSPFCQPVASGASVPVPQGVAGYCQPNISSQPIASAASFVAATVAQSSAFQAIVGSTTQSVQEATTLPPSQSHQQISQVSSQAQPSSISLPLPNPLAGGLNNGSNNNMTIQANLSNLSAAVADMDACFNNSVNNNNDQDNAKTGE